MSRILVLDAEQGTLHVVSGSVRSTGRPESAASFNLGEPLTVNNGADFGRRVREALKAAGIAPAPAHFVVGRDRVILKDIKIPPVAASEEVSVVRFQASKDMTEAAEAVVLDYYMLDRAESDGQRRVITASLRKDAIRSLNDVCAAAGLKLASVTPRPICTYAALQRAIASGDVTAPEARGASVAVVTRGEKWGELLIARDGQVVFSSSITGTSLNSETALLGVLRRNLAVYNAQAGAQPIEALYVAEAGGPSGWSGRIRAGLTIPVQSFDPLAGVENTTPVETRGHFAGLVGLLQLKSKGQDAGINFITPRQPVVKETSTRSKVLTLVSLLTVLIVGGLGFGFFKVQEKNRQLQQLTLTKSNLDKEFTMLEVEDKRIKIFKDWHEKQIVWSDVLYDLTDQFPDIKATQLEQFRGEPYAPEKGSKVKTFNRMTLKITTTSDTGLSDLTANLRRGVDGQYTTGIVAQSKGGAGARLGQSYELRADIQKRPPEAFTRSLGTTVPDKPARAAETSPMGAGGGMRGGMRGFFGGMGGGGAMGMGGGFAGFAGAMGMGGGGFPQGGMGGFAGMAGAFPQGGGFNGMGGGAFPQGGGLPGMGGGLPQGGGFSGFAGMGGGFPQGGGFAGMGGGFPQGGGNFGGGFPQGGGFPMGGGFPQGGGFPMGGGFGGTGFRGGRSE